ncbi:MAG: hypothetical protein Q4B48_03365 [Syntrophomonadaceae bacterium]|nr:hypothetical protein [Syntrophomonadaceae bacterium]
MNEVYRILDEMEAMLREGKKMPFASTKTMVETVRFLECMDRLRAVLPDELEEARKVVSERERIYNEACAQADQYVEYSRSEVARIVDDSEIVRATQERAEAIMAENKAAVDALLAESNASAEQLMQDADEYTERLFSHMEKVFRRGLESLAQGKQELHQRGWKGFQE